MKRIAAALVLVSAVAVSAGAQAQPRPYVSANPAQAEAIYGAVFDDQGLTLKVSSNGCTKKEDFAVRVRREGRASTVLAVRLRPDRCRSFARGSANLTWGYNELGIRRGADVKVLNRFAAW